MRRLAAAAFLAGIIAAAGLSGCAGLPRGADADEKAVVAEGWAPADPRDPEGTRRRALADAQRKAVEQVAGVSVAALTSVVDSVTLRQKMTAEARGWVSRYEVLGEASQDGFLKVRIRAFVRRGGPQQAVGLDPAGARVALRVRGRGPADEDWGESASAAIRRELLARGFDVTGGIESAPQLLALRGEASAAPVLDARLGAFHSSRARVSLRAVDPKSGAVLWESAQEASALDMDPGAASVKAVEMAGALLGRRAAGEVTELIWKRF